jgi:hypothetical protein
MWRVGPTAIVEDMNPLTVNPVIALDHVRRTVDERVRLAEDLHRARDVRQRLGATPWARLKARLKASSDSSPTRRATAATPTSALSNSVRARYVRHSVR